MPQKSSIQNWLQQKNLSLQPGFTDELQRLAAAYKKTAEYAA